MTMIHSSTDPETGVRFDVRGFDEDDEMGVFVSSDNGTAASTWLSRHQARDLAKAIAAELYDTDSGPSDFGYRGASVMGAF